MTYQTYQPITWLILIALVLGAAAAQAGLPPAAQAGAGLPPRATPTPSRPDHDRNSPPVGAYIELAAPGAPAGDWVIVQWQDSAGNWHDVEGWRGLAANSSRWWVHPKDFGSGPFRWVVTAGPDGAVLKVSEPFHLPSGANETTLVTVKP